MRSDIITNDAPWQSIAPTDMSRVYDLLRQAQQKGTGHDLGSFDSIDAGSYSESPEAIRARELGMGALEGLQGTDRLANVERALALAREKSQPGFETDQRNIGKKAAAFGRIGSGIVNRDLADLSTERERGFGQLREGLTIDALDKSMADQQAKLSGALQAGGQFRGEDLDTAGFRQGLRSEARGERSAGLGFKQSQADQGMREAGFLSDIAGREADLGRVTRGELEGERLGKAQYEAEQRGERRDERGWQNLMQQQGLSDLERQVALEEGTATSQANRQNQWLQLLMQGAFGGAQSGEDGGGAFDPEALMQMIMAFQPKPSQPKAVGGRLG